ncbi:MAG: iron-containing alcohol dehydrogenase [Pseudomonadota bacterium]
MSLLDPQDWTFPVPIAYGPGRLREIGRFCRDAGVSKPLLVTDQCSRDLPFIAAAHEHLEADGLKTALFAGISPNPCDTDIEAGCRVFRDGAHDGIIGIGGGSGMDGAKAIALTARSGVSLWEFEFERTPPDVSGSPAFPPLISVPTTAGTGAETEGTAMITDTAQGMKFCVWHPEFRPVCALLDPELTLGLPTTLTAWTGLDALTHAIEAYTVPGFHPLCDGAALEGLRLITRWLPQAVSDPASLEARGGMLVGSCLAGIAFLKGLGIVHAVSHMVGAEFNTHHGLTNAVILPAALRFNAPALVDRARPMAQAMGLEHHDAEAIHAAVCRMLDEMEIPSSLGEMGVPGDCAQRIAAKAMRDSAAGTNARIITASEMEAVVTEVLVTAR